jgi:hypothetical protein
MVVFKMQVPAAGISGGYCSTLAKVWSSAKRFSFLCPMLFYETFFFWNISSCTFSLFSFSFCRSNMVPNTWSQRVDETPKPFFLVFVMMQVVVAPQRLHPFKRRVPGMDGVMHGSIQQVAQHKARKKRYAHSCASAGT